MENLIPISFVKQFTPLVNGDMVRFSISEGVVTEPWDEQDTLKYHSNPASYDDVYVVSFAPRPNTGKQPVRSDVMVNYATEKVSIDYLRPVIAGDLCWHINLTSWKPNHEALLAKYQSEQGANEMYTKQNTAAATAAKIWPGANPEAQYILKFFNFSGDNSLWLNNGKWEKFFSPIGEPNDNSVNFLHRPANEQEAAHTDGQGVVTYAFSYALDHLTKKATHYNCENRTFYRLMSGEFAQVLTDLEWIVSDCTTNSELIHNIKGEFWSLNGTFANRSDKVEVVDGERVDHEKAQQVVNTDLHTPAMVDAVGSWCVSKFDAVADEDKPIFTQEMYDAGELPPIGSKVLFDSQKVTIVGATTKFMPIFELPNGYVDSFNSKSSYRPIDNRSDSQKLVDDILFYLHDDGVKSYRDAVEKALGKFTITLNKE